LVGERLEERRNTLSEALLRADQSAIQRIPAVSPSSISVTAAEASALTRPAVPPHGRRRLYYALGGLILVGAAGAGLALVSSNPPESVARPVPVTPAPEPAPTPAPTEAAPPTSAATSLGLPTAEPDPPAATPPVPRTYQQAPRASSRPPPPKKPPNWKHDPGF
jgi:hypothetical protein